MKSVMQKISYWLYVNTGVRRRDMTIYWAGKLDASHLDSMLHDMSEWKKSHPDASVEQLRYVARLGDTYVPPKEGWVWQVQNRAVYPENFVKRWFRKTLNSMRRRNEQQRRWPRPPAEIFVKRWFRKTLNSMRRRND